MSTKKTFQPNWINEAPKKGSFRSIFKFGNPEGFKHPNENLFKEIKDKFKLTNDDFKQKVTTGNEIVDLKKESGLELSQIKKFISICGDENVSSKEYDRLKFSTGKTVEEAMKLRIGKVEKISDLVVHPRNKQEISEIVK